MNPYTSSQTPTWIITPNGGLAKITFSSFNVDGSDFLTIYDGDSDVDPIIGSYNNSNPPPSSITASNTTGELFIKFEADGMNQADGWVANISCETLLPPANDECASALDITPVTDGFVSNNGPFQILGSTASTETMSTTCPSFNSGDVWLSFTSNINGSTAPEVIEFEVTPGSNSDIAVVVYTGPCGSLTEVACANAGVEGDVETITFTESFTAGDIQVRDGVTYYVRVIAVSDVQEPFTLVTTAASEALPVTIKSFTGKSINNQNLLQWTVAGEKKLSGYEVERSFDSKNWELIGTVKATGAAKYDFTDRTAKEGKNFYRLKMVDNDGAVRYSQIVNVQTGSTTALQVYPNPAQNNIFVTGLNSSDVKVTVLNSIGQPVITTTANASALNANGFNINDLMPGSYLLQVTDGTDIKSTRFIKM